MLRFVKHFVKQLSIVTILLAVLAASIYIKPVHAQASIETIIDAAFSDLSTRLGVTVSRQTLDTTDQYSWSQNKYPDASLGCPIQGQTYPKNPTNGYSIDISFKGSVYNYRATVDGTALILCTPAGPAQAGATLDLAQPQVPAVFVNTVTYDVVLKINAANSATTDVYLVDPFTNQESLLLSLQEVHRDHYHPAEYHNGNLYVIHRRGDPQTNPNWTDELWVYDQNQQGQKLFSSNQGLDFRASDDGTVAVLDNLGPATAPVGSTVTFINQVGTTLKTFSSTQLGVDAFAPLAWGVSSFWVRNSVAASPIQTMIKFARAGATFQPVVFTVPNIPISDFAFNPYAEVVAFSDYPVMFAAEEEQAFKQSGKTVTLFVYDLNTKTSQPVATAIAKKFNPDWPNPLALNYDNPQSATQLTMSLATMNNNGAIGAAICSPRDSATPAMMTVANNTQQEISLNWIDVTCKETPYQVIAPGASVQQESYLGHIWIVRTKNTQMRRLFSAQPGIINIP